MNYPQFDLHSTPFTNAGSWMAVAELNEKEEVEIPGLYLRSVRNVFRYSPLWRIELWHNEQRCQFTAIGTPHHLELKTDNGSIAEITFDGGNIVRFRSLDLDVKLIATDKISQATPAGKDTWRSFWRSDYGGPNYFMHIIRLSGEVEITAPWTGMRSAAIEITFSGELAIVESGLEWTSRQYWPTFNECMAENLRDFDHFLQGFMKNSEFWEEQIMAAYLNWACLVNPAGHLQRPCMLVSKHRMSGMWAWDHCFNAMAMIRKHPRLAWNQFMVVFDHVNSQGALPDLLTECGKIQVYEKPPVHGWALAKMIRLNPGFFTPEILNEAYEALASWTNYWLIYRDPYHTGLPVYYHGNDSGWDNNTWFQTTMPLASPELSAYLVIQMEVLAFLGKRLGIPNDWQEKSQNMLKLLLDKCWTGGEFKAVNVTNGLIDQAGDSLLPYMAILLGKRLPKEIYQNLKKAITTPGRFLTEWGLASESTKSPLYNDAGYSRGPIWAPANLMAVAALSQGGDRQAARELAHRYCKLCAQNGFAENFNARTGQPNNEKTLSWTASIFLILTEFLIESENSDFIF